MALRPLAAMATDVRGRGARARGQGHEAEGLTLPPSLVRVPREAGRPSQSQRLGFAARKQRHAAAGAAGKATSAGAPGGAAGHPASPALAPTSARPRPYPVFNDYDVKTSFGDTSGDDANSDTFLNDYGSAAAMFGSVLPPSDGLLGHARLPVDPHVAGLGYNIPSPDQFPVSPPLLPQLPPLPLPLQLQHHLHHAAASHSLEPSPPLLPQAHPPDDDYQSDLGLALPPPLEPIPAPRLRRSQHGYQLRELPQILPDPPATVAAPPPSMLPAFLRGVADSLPGRGPTEGQPAPSQAQPSPCLWTKCASKFTDRDTLVLHVCKAHIDGRNKDNRCSWEECRETFGEACELERHVLQHLKADIFGLACQWDRCAKRFSTFDHLTTHVSEDHVGSGKALYECNWRNCPRRGKIFTQRQKLMRHIQTHTGDKPVLCIVCNKRFSESNVMMQHMRIHTGERPYVCAHPGCDRKFTAGSALTIHARVHSGERPFACPTCPSAFAESSNLAKHMRIHIGLKPFPCAVPTCPKRFLRADQAARHLRTHRQSPYHRTTGAAGASAAGAH